MIPWLIRLRSSWPHLEMYSNKVLNTFSIFHVTVWKSLCYSSEMVKILVSLFFLMWIFLTLISLSDRKAKTIQIQVASGNIKKCCVQRSRLPPGQHCETWAWVAPTELWGCCWTIPPNWVWDDDHRQLLHTAGADSLPVWCAGAAQSLWGHYW